MKVLLILLSEAPNFSESYDLFNSAPSTHSAQEIDDLKSAMTFNLEERSPTGMYQVKTIRRTSSDDQRGMAVEFRKSDGLDGTVAEENIKANQIMQYQE